MNKNRLIAFTTAAALSVSAFSGVIALAAGNETEQQLVVQAVEHGVELVYDAENSTATSKKVNLYYRGFEEGIYTASVDVNVPKDVVTKATFASAFAGITPTVNTEKLASEGLVIILLDTAELLSNDDGLMGTYTFTVAEDAAKLDVSVTAIDICDKDFESVTTFDPCTITVPGNSAETTATPEAATATPEAATATPEAATATPEAATATPEAATATPEAATATPEAATATPEAATATPEAATATPEAATAAPVEHGVELVYDAANSTATSKKVNLYYRGFEEGIYTASVDVNVPKDVVTNATFASAFAGITPTVNTEKLASEGLVIILLDTAELLSNDDGLMGTYTFTVDEDAPSFDVSVAAIDICDKDFESVTAFDPCTITVPGKAAEPTATPEVATATPEAATATPEAATATPEAATATPEAATATPEAATATPEAATATPEAGAATATPEADAATATPEADAATATPEAGAATATPEADAATATPAAGAPTATPTAIPTPEVVAMPALMTEAPSDPDATESPAPEYKTKSVELGSLISYDYAAAKAENVSKQETTDETTLVLKFVGIKLTVKKGDADAVYGVDYVALLKGKPISEYKLHTLLEPERYAVAAASEQDTVDYANDSLEGTIEDVTFIAAEGVVISVNALYSKIENGIEDTDNYYMFAEDEKSETTGGYVVNITESTNGTVEVDKEKALEGETVKITAKPASGRYVLSKIEVTNDSTKKTIDVKNYSFTMPASDVTIKATFKTNTGSGGSSSSSHGGATIATGGSSSSVSTGNVISSGSNVSTGSSVSMGGSITPTSTFVDLDTVPWAVTAINTLATNGIVNGTTATTFEPLGAVTRAQFAKMVCITFNVKEQKPASQRFMDVAPTDWFYGYVEAAAAIGIINGVSDTAFDPNAIITREQMAAMMYRGIAYSNATLMSGSPVTFADSALISGYAVDAVNALSSAGVISGKDDGTFAPQETATRAQAAAIIYQYYMSFAK